MKTSRPVTIEDAVRYDGGNWVDFARVAVTSEPAPPRLVLANGRVIEVLPGQWVVRYAPGDVGVMDDGEYRRYFGEPEGLTAMHWKPGDRVGACLPDRDASRRRGGATGLSWVSGTVREVDSPGLPRGVRVDLDREVNGVRDCYATHSELRVLGR